ncbi:hypothetical protein [Pseudoalteromonas phenolica]|uniref:Uncharacterized protein n=1 Tax=Pseudoalteromonas phenolica TaxID=161398 RepID=A0A0S2K4I7_9GAMM|nr:hypothetical protein [Pseudoalteromonas phenolica]ALO43048.1 hypothetical protein PP2015_2559 [Pseudoalteromonas phenolica]MBE0355801.1 hypothetical protein [Pseudoalteromonas phenolica O-BC30]RXE96569.1 hypothetical protein D9981_11780 [Pseudoalteromonas phenolica O-BC30]
MTINNISALLEQLNCKAGAAELARQSKSINCQGMAIEERLMNALDAEIQQRAKIRSARLQKQAKLAYEHIFVQTINKTPTFICVFFIHCLSFIYLFKR